MVNSDKGITNLHVPSDVVDATMPAMIRTRTNVELRQQTTQIALIPDRSYLAFMRPLLNL
jgi:monomeric isocitrate dehydrogenase